MTAYNTVDKLKSVPVSALEGLAMAVIESSEAEEKILFKVADLIFLRLYSEIYLTFEDISKPNLTMHSSYVGDELNISATYDDIELTMLKL